MTETNTAAPESLEYRTEVKQLLDILAHSLYTDREIFLRELISNSSDALNRVQFEILTNHEVVDADRKLAIEITFDADSKTLTISDSGIGMSRDDMVENLGTIAHSGAKEFLQQAAEGKNMDEIIGQFGVGFYSVFMVAQEVSVTSRSHHPDDQAWTWRSAGDSRYTLEASDKADRGTSIVVQLKDDAQEFANAWRLEQIVKKHSDYVSFPIYVVDANKEETEEEEEPTPVNRQTAIWRQSPSSVEADDYLDFYKQLTFDFDEPMLHFHMVADMPVNLRSILYVPSARERSTLNPRVDHGLRLYSRKILIQEQNKDLLPEYMRFVDGVVDSEDLPLNVSRETVQSNPMIRQMRRALTNRVLKEIRTLSENGGEKYDRFWTEFGVFLKEGIAVDPSNKDDLIDLLRFHSSSAADEATWMSLQAYTERMGDEQSEIYYVLGDDMKSVARSPHLDYFKAHDIEVLYLIDPIDGFMMSVLRDYKDKALRNIDDAGLDLADGETESEEQTEPAVADDDFSQLVERFKIVLGDQVTDVRESRQLVNSPCRLVSPEDSYDRDLQRVRRLMEEDFETPKKLLEINRRHPMIANLSAILQSTGDDAVVDASIAQLFDNALLLEGFHPNPSDMVDRMQKLMEAAVAARVDQ